MQIVKDNLLLCDDCTIAACNGDFSGLDFHYDEPTASKRRAEIETGLETLGAGLVPSFDSETNDGIEEFSNVPCA
jgi:hypothetical protein